MRTLVIAACVTLAGCTFGGGGIVPFEPAPAPVADEVLTDAEVRRLEADNIRTALRLAKGKVSGPGGAAAMLGMKPTTLASRIKALGIANGRGLAG